MKTSLAPINPLTLNGMLQYIRQLKNGVSLNPLIVSSPLQNKCSEQQFTAKYQKEESPPPPQSLSFRSPVPTNQIVLQWTVTCFSFGGQKNAPQAFQSSLSFLPFTSSDSSGISSQRGGSHGGNYSVIHKKRGGKKFLLSSHSIGIRVTHSSHLSQAVTIWYLFNFLSSRDTNGGGQPSDQNSQWLTDTVSGFLS